MAEHFVAPTLGIDLNAVGTAGAAAEFALGTIVCGTDSSGSYSAEYMYVLADAAIDQYDIVHIDDDYQITALTTTIAAEIPIAVGIAQVAFADTQHGWVVISGSGTVNSLTAGSDDTRVYTSATAGHVATTATAHDCVEGLKLNADVASGVATFHAAGRLRVNSDHV